MSLNIKNERVHALAREAARVTGKTQTGAIEMALEELLAEHSVAEKADRQGRLDRLMAIGRRYRDDPGDPGGEIIEIDDLYDDETGLPK